MLNLDKINVGMMIMPVPKVYADPDYASMIWNQKRTWIVRSFFLDAGLIRKDVSKVLVHAMSIAALLKFVKNSKMGFVGILVMLMRIHHVLRRNVLMILLQQQIGNAKLFYLNV